MGIPPSNLPQYVGRRISADGTVSIICSVCGRQICRQIYNRFSTAICSYCQGAIEQGQDPSDVAERRRIEELNQADQVANELGSGGFLARGMKRRVQEIIDAVKQRVSSKRRSITTSE